MALSRCPSVLAQFVQAHVSQGFHVCADQNHRGRHAGLQGFHPTVGAQAPAIAGFQASEAVFGTRGGEVVAAGLGKRQEVGRDAGADDMGAVVVDAGVAATIAEKSGQGVKRAGHQVLGQDVFVGFCHGPDCVL